MAKNIKTHIICYDDHRGLPEEVNKRFTDNSRYEIQSFQTKEGILDYFAKVKGYYFCKIAILGLHEDKEQYSLIEELTSEIKKTDKDTRLILIGPPDRMEEIKKAVKNNIEAYIPRNSNMILRIHNTVKKIMSEHSIGVFKRRRNLSLVALLTFLLISLLTIIISYFRLPQYF